MLHVFRRYIRLYYATLRLRPVSVEALAVNSCTSDGFIFAVACVSSQVIPAYVDDSRMGEETDSLTSNRLACGVTHFNNIDARRTLYNM